jgi:HEAT repeat protein
MARKTSKEVSAKKHSPIPVTAAPSATSPKKAAAEAAATPANPVVKAQTPAIASPAAAAVIAAPVCKETAGHCCKTAGQSGVAEQIAALRNSDADVARDAATALGRAGDASAVEPLIEVLNNANDYFHCVVRAAAASSLAQLKDARAFEPLVNAVRDTMAEASAEAVRALATMGDKRATGVLVDVVRNQSGYFLSTVRLAAVAGLKQLGGEAARAELARVAADGSEDAVIREAAGK